MSRSQRGSGGGASGMTPIGYRAVVTTSSQSACNCIMAVAECPAMYILALIAAAAATTTPVPVPGGEGGIRVDDLVFSSRLHRLIVPGGRTGHLDPIDPA